VLRDQMSFFQAFVYLLAAVISVPLAKRLGLGSVLGYLLAGIVIGPFGLQLVGSAHGDVMHIAEFGVVMMLFVIGLELRPTVLWKMRGQISLGGAQVLGTAGAVSVLAIWLGLRWQMAVTVGLRLHVYRETFGSAVDLSVCALGTLGLDGERARRAGANLP
jgi:glutathione-regulated potassium-efflux system ancillary protein KefC